ncbi:MAG: hypothetical protein R3F48_16810 [Candidatus Zixiibacteriota bacterium]
MIRMLFSLLLVSFMFTQTGLAADGTELRTAFDHILKAELEGTSFPVVDISLSHKDFVLHLDSGSLSFAEPVRIDGADVYFAAYFIGDGSFTIAPTEIHARKQIENAFDEQEYSGTIKKALLVFSQPIYEQLKAVRSQPQVKFKKRERGHFRNDWKQFNKKEDYYFVYETLRNIYEPSDEPFLFVNLQKNSIGGSEYYLYNPLDAEEIKVYKNKVTGPMFREFVKTISSYSCLLDSTGRKCRVVSEPQVKTLHNDMHIDISDLGIMTSQVTISYEVLKPPAQMLWMSLHQDMIVDSIIDDNGKPVAFIRYEDSGNKSFALYLFLNQPGELGDTLNLTLFYHGQILEFSGRDIINQSGMDWYPTYIERDSALSNIVYSVPHYDDMRFKSTGVRKSDTIEGHTETSVWSVDTPEPYIYFDFIER